MKNKLNYSFNLSFRNNSLSSKDISKETFLKDRHNKKLLQKIKQNQKLHFISFEKRIRKVIEIVIQQRIFLFCVFRLLKRNEEIIGY